MSSRLIFFGTENFSAPSLEALISAGYDIVAVVTKPDTTRGRGRKLTMPLVKEVALAHKLRVLQPHKLLDIAEELRELKADAAVLVSYGKIIPQSILDIFEPIGVINVHPSLLPRYRGPSPIETAILAGDIETGVSIMKLEREMDAGPVFSQTVYPLNPKDTKPTLYARLSQLGAEELVRVLPSILDGNLQPTRQNHDHATYCPLLKKEDGELHPEQETATVLERKVRAYLGYPKSYLTLGGHRIIVTSARAVEVVPPGTLVVPCAQETQLLIEELIAPSGRTMIGDEFMRGYLR